MKLISKALSLLLVFALIFSLAAMSGCGKSGTEGTDKKESTTAAAAAEPVAAVKAADIKIGVLAESDFGTSVINYQKMGIEATAKALKIDAEKQIIFKTNVTDVTFDAEAKFTTAAETTTKATTTKKPEKAPKATTTTKKSTDAVPVEVPKPDTAAEAVSDFVKKGCNIVIATSTVYKDFTAYLAKQLKDVIFLQYGTGKSDLPNLQYYSDKMYEAFYVAGYTAGKMTKSGEIAFAAGVVNDTVINNVNAYAYGAMAANEKAKVKFKSTDVSFDLVLETTIVEDIAKNTKCDILAQSLTTALPQVAAEKAKIKCFGYGYDMSGDAKTYNLFSVIWDWSVYFTKAFTDITKGTFSGGSYEGGLKEGVVALTDLRLDNGNLKKVIADAQKRVTSGSVDVLASVNKGDNGYAANIEKLK